jgi:hypothetical protein
MALDIFVQRDAGDRRGDDVVDPLIGDNIPIAIQRGRNELDEKSSSPQKVNSECVHRTGLELGQHVRVFDFDTGEVWNGKVASITHKQEGRMLTTSLVIERPSNFYLG